MVGVRDAFYSKTKRFCSVSCSRSYSSNSKKASILARLQVDPGPAGPASVLWTCVDPCGCRVCVGFRINQDLCFSSQSDFSHILSETEELRQKMETTDNSGSGLALITFRIKTEFRTVVLKDPIRFDRNQILSVSGLTEGQRSSVEPLLLSFTSKGLVQTFLLLDDSRAFLLFLLLVSFKLFVFWFSFGPTGETVFNPTSRLCGKQQLCLVSVFSGETSNKESQSPAEAAADVQPVCLQPAAAGRGPQER